MQTPFQPSIPPIISAIPLYALPHRVDIWPAVVEYDNAGGRIPYYPTVRSTNVPCAITHQSVDDELTYERLGVTILYKIGFATDPLLQPDDRLTFRTTLEKVRTLNVMTVENVAEMNVFWTVTATETLAPQQNV